MEEESTDERSWLHWHNSIFIFFSPPLINASERHGQEFQPARCLPRAEETQLPFQSTLVTPTCSEPKKPVNLINYPW